MGGCATILCNTVHNGYEIDSEGEKKQVQTILDNFGQVQTNYENSSLLRAEHMLTTKWVGVQGNTTILCNTVCTMG